MCEKQFLISVVIPVYNTEQYLAETVQSVINQSIGFEKNIQIIFVNNATEDNSGLICQYYQSVYPANIKYIELEKNVGPSGARNAGKKLADGKYINFLDSDDVWEKKAFHIACDFLDTHTEVDVVACRIRHFDAHERWHLLDYKFNKNRVCDIFQDPNCVQLSLCSTIIRYEAAMRHDLDERLKHAEDAKFLTEIILDKQKYGLLRNAVFRYRTRKTGTSLLQSVGFSPEWYFETPREVYAYIIDYAEKKMGCNVLYAQFLAMYDLQWRLKKALPSEFTEDDKSRYLQILHDTLQKIEDGIILDQKYTSLEGKLYFLRIKYGENFAKRAAMKDGWYTFNGLRLFKLNKRRCITISNMRVERDIIKIYGRLNLPMLWNDVELSLSTNEHMYSLSLQKANDEVQTSIFEQKVDNKWEFYTEVPLENIEHIKFVLSFDEYYQCELDFECGRFSKLASELNVSYYATDKYILYKQGNRILVDFLTPQKLRAKEKQLRHHILRHAGYKVWGYRVLLFWILRYKQTRPNRKHLWLISDRINSARDNGFCLFNYLCEKKVPNARVLFLLSKNSEDYTKVSSVGKIIDPKSKSYKLVYTLADKMITAYLDQTVVYPFAYDDYYFRDCIPDNLIYLQHGIIKDDFSGDQNKYNKNICKFITSAKLEQESILAQGYGYRKSEVPITGLARYDMLPSQRNTGDNEKTRKVLLIAPTWRLRMEGNVWNSNHGKCDYNSLFADSRYYMFFNNLINDDRILKAMRERGYCGIFQLHPVITSQGKDFETNDVFSLFGDSDLSAEDLFEKTTLLVTDYSSIAFDYAYCGSAVIYTQFDKDEFYQMQGYDEGYFDYETMGFGPVCYDYESTVEAIIRAIENDCIMEEKYQKRVDDFFAYRDNKNCERIYQEILKMDEEN